MYLRGNTVRAEIDGINNVYGFNIQGSEVQRLDGIWHLVTGYWPLAKAGLREQVGRPSVAAGNPETHNPEPRNPYSERGV